MAETRFTPGPWTWGADWPEISAADTPGNYDGIPIKYADLALRGAGKKPIIPVRVDHYDIEWDGYACEFTDADRALIAAAPEMYAALEAVVAHYSASLDYRPPYVAAALKALTSARGGTDA